MESKYTQMLMNEEWRWNILYLKSSTYYSVRLKQ